MELLDLIIAKLSDIPELKGNVGGSVTLEATKKDIKRTPSCAVIPLSAQGEEGEKPVTGSVEQKILDMYGVFIMVDNNRYMQGKDSIKEYEAIREQVRLRLIGWRPNDDFFPTIYTGGSIQEFGLDTGKRNFDNLIVWGEFFTFSYMFCNNLI